MLSSGIQWLPGGPEQITAVCMQKALSNMNFAQNYVLGDDVASGSVQVMKVSWPKCTKPAWDVPLLQRPGA